MKMKWTSFVGVLLFGLAAVGHSQETPKPLEIPMDVDGERVKDAGNQAITALLKDMLSRKDFPKRFAVLPLQQDIENGYFVMQLRNAFTNLGGANGYELYTRMDADWNNLLNEIKWGQQYGDTMDQATVQKFGRIQGVQGLIVGRITGITRTEPTDTEESGVKVRVNIQAFEVETGRQIWGAEQTGFIAGKPLKYHFKFEPWMLWVAGGIVGVVVLLVVLGQLKRAARPR